MNLAFRDVRHALGRFIITCIGLSLLLGVVMGMVGIFRGLVDESVSLSRAVGADVWVVEGGRRGPFAEASRLPGDTREAMAVQSGVAAAGAVSFQNIELVHNGQNKRLLLIGAEPGRPGSSMPIKEGRGLVKSRTELIADRKAGFLIDDRVRIGRDTFTVVGLTDGMTGSSGDPVAMISLRDAQKAQFDADPTAVRREQARSPAAGGSSDLVNAVIVRLHPSTSPEVFAQSIRRWKHLSAFSQAEQEIILTKSVVERASRQIGLFTVILLIVATVIISLIIYTMTMDKMKSIATLKLIGAPDRTIIALIMQQSLAMGVTGFTLGYILLRLGKDAFPRRLVFETSDSAALFVIVVAACFLASLVGVRAALRIDPASALGG